MISTVKGAALAEVAGKTAGQLHSMRGVDPKADERTARQEVLERAVAKLVLIGEQVGVSTSDMIALLESGLTVAELVEYLTRYDSEAS